MVAGAALTLFLVFFFLKDGPRLWEWVVRLFPQTRRADVREAGEIGWRTIGAYLRGTAVVALVDAVFIGLALLVLGVPLVLAITTGSLLWGVIGAFLAVPFTAVAARSASYLRARAPRQPRARAPARGEAR